MAAKKCLICNGPFVGRRDAKTCSARCRKRLQKVRSSLYAGPVFAEREYEKTVSRQSTVVYKNNPSKDERIRGWKKGLLPAFGLLLGLGFLLGLFSTPAPANAATSSSYLNFQSRLLTSTGSVVADGNYNIEFKITNDPSAADGGTGACSGSCLWRETRQNSASQGVRVVNGYMSVNLGSVTSFPAINWDQQLYLTMNIGGTSTGASPTYDGEMNPRITLTALPYAFIAGQLAQTSGANRGTLSFAGVTNNPNLLLPDVASGTVLVSTTGVQLQGSTPGTQQTGNINISGTGLFGEVDASKVATDTLSFGNESSGIIEKWSTVGSTGVSTNQLVVLANESGNLRTITTTTPRDQRIYGIAQGNASSGGGVYVATSGTTGVLVDTAAVNIGDQLVSSSTAGRATVDNSATTGILGIARSAKAGGSNGSVTVDIRVVSGQYSPIFRGASDTTTALQIQRPSTSDILFTADTSNNKIVIGNATGTNTDTTQLIVDSASADPTIGFAGAIYYNTLNNKFRCYTTAWGDCSGSGGTTSTLTQIYANGSTSADQTLNLASAKGGGIIIKDYAGDTSAFQVQNANSQNLFQVDASNSKVVVDGGIGGEITPFTTSGSTLPVPRDAYGSVTANGYLYIVGGHNSADSATSGGRKKTIYYAKVNADGSIGSWKCQGQNTTSGAIDYCGVTATNTNTLTAALSDGSAVAYNGYIYLTGGYNGSSVTTVQYAKLNADGSTGAWTTTTSLNAARDDHSAIVMNGYLYVVAGENGGVTNGSGSTQYAKINNDGSIGAWTNAGDVINIGSGVRAQGTATANGYIYLVGGDIGGQLTSIYYTKPNSDGSIGAWTTASNSLPIGTTAGSAYVANGYLYLTGGFQTGPTNLTSTYYAKINGDGSVGTWSTSTRNLPAARMYYGFAGMMVNGYMYVIGGTASAGGTSTNTAYYTSVPRVTLGGTLDLLGINGIANGDAAAGGQGGVGGELIAGNTNIVGSLNVQGAVSMQQALSVNGNFNAGGDVLLNSNNTGAIQPWQTGTGTGLAVRDSDATVTANGYVYVIGGVTGGTGQSTAYYAKLNANGNTGNFTTTTAMPANRVDAAGIYANGYIYIIGGTTTAGSAATAQSTVLYAKVNADGTLGNWITSPNSMPAARSALGSAALNGYIYAFGGNDTGGSAQSNVYFAKLNADGSTGAWSTTTATGAAMSYEATATANGYVYVNTSNSGLIVYAKPNADGTITSWNNSTLPANRSGATMGIANGNIYVIGGASGSGGAAAYTSTVFGPLNADGSVGTWYCQGTSGDCTGATQINTTALPAIRGYMGPNGVVANGYLYFIGGEDNTGAAKSTIYYTSTARTKIDGSLDLVGDNGEFLSEGGSGGSLTAGNTSIVGSLNVQGAASFAQGLSIDKSLAVFGDEAIKTMTNTSAAFQVQNSNGAQLFKVDTTNPVSDLTSSSTANLVTNGSFEDGSSTIGWAVKGSASVAQSASQMYIGNNSLAVTTTALANDGAKYNLTTTTLATNTQYTLTLSVKLLQPNSQSSVQTANTIQIGRAEDGSTDSSCATGQTISSAGWTTLTCTFTTGATSGTPYIYIKQTDATARTIYIDGVQLSRSYILQNSSIEQAIAGNWTAKGTTPTTHAQDATQFYAGTHSLKIVTQATANQGTKQNITLNDNTTYSLHFNAIEGSTFFSTIEAGYSSDGSTDNTVCTTAQGASASNWESFNCTFTTPASHSGTPYIYIKMTDAAIHTLYLDNIQLSTGNYFTAYREGTISLNGIVTSPSIFQNQTNSTTAFQVQNASGNSLINVDTVNNNVALVGGPGDIQPWQTNTSTGYTAYDSECTVTANGYLYAIGGEDSGQNAINAFQYAKINANGSLGNWTGTTMTTNGSAINRSGPACAVANGYVYVLGGTNNTNSTGGQTTSYYAKLNSDGSVGTWAATTSIPGARNTSGAAVYNGYIYYIGGLSTSNSATTDAYYAKVNADGTIGTWSDSIMAGSVGGGNAVIINGYLYTHTGNVLQYAKLPNSGGTPGTWNTSAAAIPYGVPLDAAGMYASDGYIYVVGGQLNASNIFSTYTYYAKPTSSGDITSWNVSAQQMPGGVQRGYFGGGVVANGYMYVISGVGTGFTVDNTNQWYTATSRVTIGASLDLVGPNGSNLADGGSSGGELTAGNTTIVGGLQVQGQTNFSQNVAVNGTFAANGDSVFRDAVNSSSAFQIQNNTGTQLINVDTTNPISDLTSNTTANLVTNGSFESSNSTNGWAIDGASVTIAQSTTQKYVGNNSLAITTPATVNRGAKYALTTTTLSTGMQYTLTLSARLAQPTSTSDPNGSISTFDIGAAYDGLTETTCLSGQTINYTTWTTFTCTFTAGTTSGTPYIFVRQSDATARTFYIDGVQLSRNTSLLQNYSIEQALSASNWQKKNGSETTHAQTSSQKYIGSNSLQVTTSSTPANQGTKQNITLNDNTTYTLTFYALGSGAFWSTMEAGYSSDGSTDTACMTTQGVDPNTWEPFTCTFTTPSSHSGTPYIYIKNTAAAAKTMYLDDIQLTTGNTLTAYREGTISINGVIVSPTTYQNQTNSTTAFQVQNANGQQLFNVDTANNNIALLGGGTGDIQPWQTNTSTGFSARMYDCTVSANGYYYVIGGQDTTPVSTNTVQYAKMNANGSLGNWSTTTAISVGGVSQLRSASACAVANGYVYIVGGTTTTADTNAQTTTYYAKLNADGTIGNWASTTAIPVAKDGASASVYNGYIYIIGGFDTTGTATTTGYYAKLNADGTVGSWSTTTLANIVGGNGSAIINGYLYITGNTYIATGNYIAYSKLGSNGTPGAWNYATATVPYPNAYDSPGVTAANGNLYIVGGIPSFGSRYTFYAKPTSTGDITTINASTQLIPDTGGRGGFGDNMPVVNGYMYVIGGNEPGASPAAQSTQYYTSLSRVSVGGSLDLVGQAGGTLSDGSTGGSLTAGNTQIVGTLNVQGQTNLAQSLSVGGVLTVGGGALFQNSINSSTAFQVQNAAGQNIFDIGTLSLTNLIANSSFESNTIGWSALAGTTLTTSTTSPVDGTQTLQATTTATANRGAIYPYLFKPNTTYTFSVSASASATTGAFFQLVHIENGSTLTTGCPTTQTLTTAMSRYTCTFTTGSTIVSGDGVGMRYTSSTTAFNFFFDAAQLEVGSANSTYNADPPFNLVANPNFETNTDGWLVRSVTGTATAASISSSDDSSNFNSRSLKFVTGTGNGDRVSYPYSAQPSSRYTLSFWGRRDTSSTNTINVGRSDTTYSTGTASQSTTTVTGSGTSWSGNVTVGSMIVYANGDTDTITAVNSNTSLTVTRSATETSQSYTIYVLSGTECLTGQTFSTTWAQYTCTWTTGATIGSSPLFYIRQTDITSDNLYIDGVTLVASSTAQAYVAPAASIQADPLYSSILLNGNSAGEIAPWQMNSTSLPAARIDPGTVTANGYMYIIGGNDSFTNPQTDVYYTKLNADGSAGTWNSTTSLPVAKSVLMATTANGYVYVVGGNGASGTTNAVYYAKLNADGTIGTWVQTNSLPLNRAGGYAFTNNGYVYEVGGYADIGATTAGTTTVYYAKLNADGTIGTWNSTSSMGTGASFFAGSVSNGYVYVIGGEDAGNSPSAATRYAKLNADGTIGTWSTSTSLPVALDRSGSATSNGYVYVIGGSNDINNFSTVYYAKLNADGTVGLWNVSANQLPGTHADIVANVSNGYIYFVDGTTVYYSSGARIKVSGSLDLVGLSGQTLTEGGSGGSLTAGNTQIVGTLNVQGQANFNQSLSLNGSFNVGGTTSLGGAIVSSVQIQPTINTASALSVQNSSGSNIANISTISWGQNLINNPSFESGTAGWFKFTTGGTETTFATSTTNPQSGTQSLSVVTTAAAGAGQDATTGQGAIYKYSNLRPNTTYLFSVYASLGGTVGGTAYAIGAHVNAADVTCTGNGTGLTFTATITRYTCGFTTGSTTTVSDYLFVKRGNTDTAIRTMYIDAAQLEYASSASSSASTFVEPPTPNLVNNPDIENNTAGWNIKGNAGVTIASSEDFAKFGTRSLKVVTTAHANDGTTFNFYPTPSSRYTLSFWAYANSSTGANISIGHRENTTTGDANCLTTQTITNTWTQYSCTFTAGATVNDDIPTIGIYIKQSDATARTIYIDGLALVAGGIAQNYTPTANNLQVDPINNLIVLNGSANGEIAPWKNAGSDGGAHAAHATTILNGYFYIFDSQVNATFAKVNADGSLGTFSTTNNDGLFRADMSVVTANGYIYQIGGGNGSVLGTVMYAKPNSDGTISKWTTTNSLPAVREDGAAVVVNGYIYYLGGTPDGSTRQTSVYFAKLNPDGSVGKWASTTSMSAGTSNMPVVTANGYIYVLGGAVGGSSSNSIYYAKPNTDGTLGSWTLNANPMGGDRNSGGGAVYNGYIYYFGGTDGGGNRMATVFYAPLNADGSVGKAVISNNPLPDARYNFGTASANGYIYIAEGQNSTGATPTSILYTSTNKVLLGGGLDLVGLSGENLADGGSAGTLTAGNTNIVGNLGVRGSASISQGLSVGDTLTVGGAASFQNSSNSSTAFQIQNASGVNNFSVTTINLVGNTTFESGANGTVPVGWAGKGGAAVSVDNTQALFGSDSMKVISNGGANGGGQYNYPLTASTQYTLSFYAKVASGTLTDIQAGRSDDGSTTTNCFGGGQTVTTAWARYSCTFTTGATISGMPFIYIDETNAVVETFYVDGVQLETGATASTYTEGNINLDGQVKLKNSANSTTAFQIQNSSGSSLLTVDTANTQIVLGAGDGATPGAITVRGAAASGSNVAGADLTFDASNGTGAAGSGNFNFRTAGPTGGGITQDAVSSTSGATGVSSFNWNHTTTTNGNRILVVSVTTFSNTAYRTVSSMTYAGAAMTKLSSQDCPIDGTGRCHTELWYKITPTSGTNSISVTLSGSADVAGGAVSYYGVDTANPFGTVATNSGSGTTYSVTVGGTSSQVLLGIVGDEGSGITQGGGQSGLWNTGAFFAINAGASKTGAPGAGFSWTSGGNAWSAIGVPINPSTNATNADTLTSRLYIQNTGNVGIGTTLPQATLDVEGTSLVKTTTNSTSAFQIQSATAANTLFTADTTNNKIVVGDATGTNNNTTLFVIDSAASDPTTGYAGAEYYNTINNKFRCYTTTWVDCAGSGSTTTLSQIYDDGATAADQTLNLASAKGGGIIIKDYAGDTSAFQIQNSSGAAVLSVDSTNSVITLNGANSAVPAAWTSTSTITGGRYEHPTIYANGYAYIIGGVDNTSTVVNTVNYAKVNADGSLGTWNTGNNTGLSARYETAAVAANGYIYLVGGKVGGSTSTDVLYTKINADGNLGNWTATTSLPSPREDGSAIVANGYIYYIAGDNNLTNQNTIYYSKLNADGTVGTSWTTGTSTSLPTITRFASVFANGYAYVIGSSGAANTVYYSKFNADGTNTSWTSTNTLSTGVSDTAAVALNGYIYVIGGSSVGVTNTVQYAKLNANGTTGTWSTTTNTNLTARANLAAFTANGYMYAVGGVDGTGTALTSVYYTSLERVKISGSLDLTGGGAQNLAEGGNQGGNLTAGNTNILGQLSVAGGATLQQGLAVGDTLTVGGSAVFKSGTNSASAFQFQNASGTTILGINTSSGVLFSNIANGSSAVGFTLTTNNSFTTAGAKLISIQNNGSEKFSIDKDGNVRVASGASVAFQGTGTTQNVITKKFICTVATSAGTVVSFDSANEGQVTIPASSDDPLVAGVVVTGTASAGQTCEVAIEGVVEVVATGNPVSVGDLVATDAFGGVTKDGFAVAGDYIGKAITSGTNTTIWILLIHS